MSEIDTEKRQKAQTVSPDTASGRDVFDEAYAGKICDSAVELEEAGRFREASKKYLSTTKHASQEKIVVNTPTTKYTRISSYLQ